MDRPAAMKRGDGTTWHAPRDEPAGRAREKRWKAPWSAFEADAL